MVDAIVRSEPTLPVINRILDLEICDGFTRKKRNAEDHAMILPLTDAMATSVL
jgi:hypothetical protein